MDIHNIKGIIEENRKISFNCGTPALSHDFLLLCLEQNLPLYSSKLDTANDGLQRLIKVTKDNIHLLINQYIIQIGIYPYRDNLYFLYTYSQETVDKWDEWTKDEFTIFDIQDQIRDIKIDTIIK